MPLYFASFLHLTPGLKGSAPERLAGLGLARLGKKAGRPHFRR